MWQTLHFFSLFCITLFCSIVTPAESKLRTFKNWLKTSSGIFHRNLLVTKITNCCQDCREGLFWSSQAHPGTRLNCFFLSLLLFSETRLLINPLKESFRIPVMQNTSLTKKFWLDNPLSKERKNGSKSPCFFCLKLFY